MTSPNDSGVKKETVQTRDYFVFDRKWGGAGSFIKGIYHLDLRQIVFIFLSGDLIVYFKIYPGYLIKFF